MDAGGLKRVGMAGLAAAGALAIAGLALSADASSGAPAGPELLPDLFVERPAELYLAGHRETRLRISNTVSNKGRGPLEMTGNGSPCPFPGTTLGRLTEQRVYSDSDHPGSPGYFERDHDEQSVPREAGCSRYHPKHQHWHFDNFARYTLLSEASGKVVAGARKVSFCVIDTGRPYPGRNGSPSASYYPQNPDNPSYRTCSETSIDGLSIGWEDTYGASLRGQGIKVTGLPRGSYCLVLETDPPTESSTAGVLAESNEDNNKRTVRLRMRLRRDVVNRVGSVCKLPVAS